jgi:hypothetical protein
MLMWSKAKLLPSLTLNLLRVANQLRMHYFILKIINDELKLSIINTSLGLSNLFPHPQSQHVTTAKFANDLLPFTARNRHSFNTSLLPINLRLQGGVRDSRRPTTSPDPSIEDWRMHSAFPLEDLSLFPAVDVLYEARVHCLKLS